ncbi:MAG TPA: VOC family protein [Actinomycetota bacterium]|jgi:catechol 2,3-dioxygenase-like lactoylglutathione lyase family enzyme|nr:VOC family protein [Actinomycetota bacterium]
MIGEIDHVYYWVRDMDAAVTFYRDVLGLALVRRDGDEWAEFEAGPVRLALHGSAEQTSGGGTVVFRVHDLDEARIVLRGRGGVLDEQVGEVEGFARFATVRDPDGNPVQLIEYLA